MRVHGPHRSPHLCLAAALAVAVLLAPSPSALAAEAPDRIRLQGRLELSNGLLHPGPADLTLSLYPTAGSNAPAYEEDVVDAPVSAGRFSVELGASPAPGSPALAAALADLDDVWVGVAVDGGGELPRQRLVSVPFALRAGWAREAATLTMTCDSGYLLAYGAGGWECTAGLSAAQVDFPWAAGDSKGGDALGLACSGCVGALDLASGVVNATHLQDGGVSSADVGFGYAASADKGGAHRTWTARAASTAGRWRPTRSWRGWSRSAGSRCSTRPATAPPGPWSRIYSRGCCSTPAAARCGWVRTACCASRAG